MITGPSSITKHAQDVDAWAQAQLLEVCCAGCVALLVVLSVVLATVSQGQGGAGAQGFVVHGGGGRQTQSALGRQGQGNAGGQGWIVQGGSGGQTQFAGSTCPNSGTTNVGLLVTVLFVVVDSVLFDDVSFALDVAFVRSMVSALA